MDIIVLVKQVPETTDVKINPKTNTLIREGVKGIINPFDTYAIEEGLCLRDNLGGKVTVLSMGPPQAEEAIREAISMGVDEGVLISDKAFAGSDTLATSFVLAKAIEKVGNFKLIICGKQTMDGDTGQVGPEVAQILDIPFATYVRKIDKIDENEAIVERLIEGGYEVVKMPLPGLITVVKEINEPRIPSLKGMMRARKIKIPIWTASDIGVDEEKVGLDGSPTRITKIFASRKEKKGELIRGGPESQAQQLVARLKQRKIINP